MEGECEKASEEEERWRREWVATGGAMSVDHCLNARARSGLSCARWLQFVGRAFDIVAAAQCHATLSRPRKQEVNQGAKGFWVESFPNARGVEM